MLCRSTSTGVLGTLLPAVSSHSQTGFTSFSEQTERSSPDLYQYHHHVSTPRCSLQSPSSQQKKPAGDVSRSTDGSNWDFEGRTSSIGLRIPDRFQKVRSENDLQSLRRSSSGSAATFVAAGSFHRTASLGCYDGDRDQLETLERLASERESAILEMSENSDDTPAGSEVSKELGEMPSMVNRGSFQSEKATIAEKQYSGQLGQDEFAILGNYQDLTMAEDKHSASSFPQAVIHTTAIESSYLNANGGATRSSAKVFDESSLHSGPQDTGGMTRRMRASTLQAPSRRMLESGYTLSSSQKEIRGPMLIIDTGFGSGGGGSRRGAVSGGRGGSGGSGGGYGDSNGVEAQYRRMLEADPGHPLLLRNYALFLHEVKHDPLKAEPYYERAILANPGDGEVLGQYAQLIWEVYKDTDRAGGYFDQALQACPDDCYLNATYASFLWSSEGDEDDEAESSQEVAHGNESAFVNNMPPVCGAAAVSA